MEITITEKQELFMNATETEVLFGGAAGGGKSYGQVVDAFLYALQYNKSKQLILRRTYPELEKSLIRTALEIYPRELYTYNSSSHTFTFKNGSLIDLGYCDNENDVYKYQSAEYDVIRFDELTHFTESMYIYLMSRLRGANNYPKMVKSSTNPGGVGHAWVKSRFIDPEPPETLIKTENGTRIFIPAKVSDNKFLMEADPDYIKRLNNLPENQRKALRDGLWDIFEGQYFSMWNPDIHVIRPFDIPEDWRRYVAMDYGRDMFACYFMAVDYQDRSYVYKEIYESDLLVSQAIERLKEYTTEYISAYYAPPDLWNKHSDTGKSTAEYFHSAGINLQIVKNDRQNGFSDLAEWIRIEEDEQGGMIARLRIMENCRNLIRCLPAIQFDKRNPNDCAKEPHEITHSIDAIRYYVSGRPKPNRIAKPKPIYNFTIEKPKPRPSGYGEKVRVI